MVWEDRRCKALEGFPQSGNYKLGSCTTPSAALLNDATRAFLSFGAQPRFVIIHGLIVSMSSLFPDSQVSIRLLHTLVSLSS